MRAGEYLSLDSLLLVRGFHQQLPPRGMSVTGLVLATQQDVQLLAGLVQALHPQPEDAIYYIFLALLFP